MKVLVLYLEDFEKTNDWIAVLDSLSMPHSVGVIYIKWEAVSDDYDSLINSVSNKD